MSVERQLQQRWYGRPGWLWLLLPLEGLFRIVAALRWLLYRGNLLKPYRAPVPVIVVGNIAVGGTGKTPVTLALCEWLRELGHRPGIVSRGYGAQPSQTPFLVTPDSDPQQAGDEPLLLARRSGCPVVIAPDRAAAVRHLLASSNCNLVISDDGLQHYALARDIELVVIDGARGLGNGHCLPVGPLREPRARLKRVDAVLINGDNRSGTDGFSFELRPTALVNLATGERLAPQAWAGRWVHALAGIGNPGRFFATLRALGIEPIEHPLPDHHPFSPADLTFGDERGFGTELPIVMTEKDAVKCAPFATARCWYLAVETVLPDSLRERLAGRIAALTSGR
jgi:tetraacyldisaccharide 4'-kinase